MEDKTIDYNDLIFACEFNQENPFDLAVDIIDSGVPNLLMKEFKDQAYWNFMYILSRGDLLSPDIYQAVLDRIKRKKFAHFNNLQHDQLIQVYNFFEKMIAEEAKHSTHIEPLVKKCGFDFGQIKLTTEQFDDLLVPENIVRTLFMFYVIESYNQVFLTLVNKYSTNVSKKKFFRYMLKEESTHTNGFLKVMKLIKQNITEYDLQLVNTYLQGQNPERFEYFGILDLETCYKQCKIGRANNLIENFWSSIKQNKFQQEYNSLYVKQIYKFYKILSPGTSQDDFYSLLNNRVNSLISEWHSGYTNRGMEIYPKRASNKMMVMI